MGDVRKHLASIHTAALEPIQVPSDFLDRTILFGPLLGLLSICVVYPPTIMLVAMGALIIPLLIAYVIGIVPALTFGVACALLDRFKLATTYNALLLAMLIALAFFAFVRWGMTHQPRKIEAMTVLPAAACVLSASACWVLFGLRPARRDRKARSCTHKRLAAGSGWWFDGSRRTCR